MIYVLDTSVILKWFLEEPGTNEAVSFKSRYETGEIDIVEPDLLIYELANVLRYKKCFPETAIKAAVKSLYDLRIKFFTPTFSLMENAVHISLKTNLSVYDCIYSSLAMKLSSPLITADRKLYLHTKPYTSVKILSEL
ncbi:MAG: type II toxin-antitoxin system VapC family toxin [Elusimicrobia bacterium]|nr:type II toxin-antitoxin system VapC family toxin [Elusimicrobiota bacterium]